MPMSTPSWAPSRTSFSTSERKVMRTMPRRAGGWVKRSFDVVTSLVLLVLLSPLLLLCGAAVWVADGWPVLFRHERVGRYGRRFHVVKFRTMDHTGGGRSEEHTSELQSQSNIVCRLLLEKKKKS